MGLSAYRIVSLLMVAVAASGVCSTLAASASRELTSPNTLRYSSRAQSQMRSRRGRVSRGTDKGKLSDYPDTKLKQIPAAPVTTDFVVEHRSALNGKQIQVSGIVVALPNNSGASDQSGVLPIANANPQPRIFLASSDRKQRDKNYDLMVLLPEGDIKYALGQTVLVTGIVDGSRNAVLLRIEN